jgi:hypothetical protein
MCKLTIKKVEKAKKPVSGEKDGKPWTLYLMECLVQVDGKEPSAIRTVKTFDQWIYQQIMALEEGKTLEFEAKQEGESAPFQFLIVPEKARGNRQDGRGKAGGSPAIHTNRQQALKLAVELERGRAMQSGDVPTPQEILRVADEFVAWLENK